MGLDEIARGSGPAPAAANVPAAAHSSASSGAHTTTILASNIHCATCVNHIRIALERFGADVLGVSVRIVGDEVVVVHTASLTTEELARAVGDEAFEVYSATTVDGNGATVFQCSYDADVAGWFDGLQGRWVPNPLQDSPEHGRRPKLPRSMTDLHAAATSHSSKKKRHIENCSACRAEHAYDSKEPASRFNRGSPSEAPRNVPSAPDISTAPPAAAHPQGRRPVSEEAAPVGQLSRDMDHQAAPDAARWKMAVAIEGMTCASCSNAIIDAVEAIQAVESVRVDLIGNSGFIEYIGDAQTAHQITQVIEDIGYGASVVELSPVPTPDSKGNQAKETLYRASLSISGMTCAACSSAITKGLQELPSVKKVDIALLTNSGVIIFAGKENIDKITEKIDDLGYDVTVEDIHEESESLSKPAASSRTVQIRVDGMYCDHCPARLTELLSNKFGSALTVEKSPSMKAPILTVTYQPRVPDLSIRGILKAIDTGEADWQASIYHPPSLEERSRQMQLHDRNRILRSLLIAFVVAIPTFIIGIVIMDLVPSSNPLRQFFMEPVWAGNVQRADWAMLILATPVYFLSADIFHVRAIKEIKALWRPGSKVPLLRRFYRFGSMNLLISAGTTVAYVASVALIIVEATGSAGTSTSSTYFDSVVFLTFFILIGRYLEAFSKAKTSDAVSMLGQLRPDQAVLVLPEQDVGSDSTLDASGPKTQTIQADLLEVGDTVVVAHGATPPADGVIVWGEGKFDESSLTGESRPVSKGVGDKIFVGTVNTGKPVSMEVTGIGGASMLEQIVAVVREGLSKRAPVERLADVLTGYFVPVISLLAVLTFVVWVSLGYSGRLSPEYLGNQAGGWAFWSLGFAISVFVAACPCGIGLAAPTALFVGIGLAARHGILVRGGGQAFQDAPDLDAIVFDKTGTLTEGGDLKVSGHEDLTASATEAKLANTMARRLEEQSTHPIAVAIAAFLADKPSVPLDATDATEVPGRGIHGTFAHTPSDSHESAEYEAAVGSPAFITSLSASLLADDSPAAHTLSAWQAEAKSVAVLALRRTAPSPQPWSVAALYGTSDPVRASAAPTIKALRAQGLQVYMLSGDHPATAAAVAATVGIPATHVFAGVLPAEKAAKIGELQRTLRPAADAEKAEGQARVAFVGDGINDAPALAKADVSIALGSGSSAALAAASFVLLRPTLAGVPRLLALSRRVMRRVRLNYGWALVYNVVLVPVAAGVLFKVRADGWYLGPVWAALAMAGSSVSVVLSSLALRWEWRQPKE